MNSTIGPPRMGGTIRMKRVAKAADLMQYAAASGDHNPIHLDKNAAQRAGLDDCIVHGMLIMAWASSAAARLFGGAEQLKSLKMRFRAPLYVGVPATVEVTVLEDSGNELEYRVRVVAPDESILATGIGKAGPKTHLANT